MMHVATDIPQKYPEHLRVLFWNIRDMGMRGDILYETYRARRVRDVFRAAQPDIVLLSEIRKSELAKTLVDRVGKGVWHIENSSRGARGSWFSTMFNTSSGLETDFTIADMNDGLDWDGAFFPALTIETPGGKTQVISVHTKSGAHPQGFNIRRTVLNEIKLHAASLAAQKIRLLAVGDFNTMGQGEAMSGSEEVRLTEEFMATGQDGSALVRLAKSHETTWMGIGDEAQWPLQSLDHAFVSPAARDMIVPVGGDAERPVYVGGWPRLQLPVAREQWVRDFSDHAPLILDLCRYG